MGAGFWSHRLERGRPLWEMVAARRPPGRPLGPGEQDPSLHGRRRRLGRRRAPAARRDARSRPAPAGGRHARGDRRRHGSGAPAGRAAARPPRRRRRRAPPAELARPAPCSRASPSSSLRNELVAAPHTSLNGPIGKQRRFAVGRAARGPQGDQARARRHGQRRRARRGDRRAARGARGTRRGAARAGLRAMVPVNMRGAAEQLALGNRITSLFVHLPVDEENRSCATRGFSRTRSAEGRRPGDGRVDARRSSRGSPRRSCTPSSRRRSSPRGCST